MTAFIAINRSKKDSNRGRIAYACVTLRHSVRYANSVVSLTHSYFYNDRTARRDSPKR